MTFLDDLTLVLDLLILVACVTFYTGFWVAIEMFRKDRVRAQAHLREGATLMGILGGILGLIGIWGEFTWPLNVTLPSGSNVLGAYDLLFFDTTVMLALVLIAFAVTVNLRRPTHFVGMLGVVVGFGVMYYGYRAYTLSLTEQPLETFLMYLAFGAAAVLSYPATLYADWFVVGPTNPGVDPIPTAETPEYPWIWWIFIGLFLGVILLAGIAALFYGFDSAWAHLASPP
jgi:uncharacterized membrane protein